MRLFLASSWRSLLTLFEAPASRADYYWDPAHDGSSGGGSGTWNSNATANWWVSGSSDSPQRHHRRPAAVFGGTGRHVHRFRQQYGQHPDIQYGRIHPVQRHRDALAGHFATININATSGTIGSCWPAREPDVRRQWQAYLSGSNTIGGRSELRRQSDHPGLEQQRRPGIERDRPERQRRHLAGDPPSPWRTTSTAATR